MVCLGNEEIILSFLRLHPSTAFQTLLLTMMDCSHEIKRHLLLGRKVMTNLDSILESRDITLPTKVRLVKAMVFPVVMYGYESWTVKKAECQRIDAFELWCWISLQSKGLSRVFCNTAVQKHQSFGAQPSSQSNSHIHT